ncbi:hypothetical protein POTOM_045431 [Populus tomentosa]|uniref:NERD domain-containing protein n=1 Tax=Populus tomentosa TaxID=118781 RepID=A0A8X7YHS9_POPTO|nr:hypothetical protein POTOM_045431 [Populus tomentosa]
MWLEIVCGMIVYKLFKCFFSDADDVLEVQSSDTNALFNVANKLEKLYGGKVYVGLRIPDADTGSRQNIDIVLVTKGEAVVISVKNFSGFVSISGDGSWVCEGEGRHKPERHPDPVEEIKKQASILESYLEQRGVALPDGYLSCKVVLPNPNLHTIHSGYFPPEVITHDQWVLLKPEPKGLFSGWIKGAFRGGKKEMQESIHQKLNFTLRTAPMWDRNIVVMKLIVCSVSLRKEVNLSSYGGLFVTLLLYSYLDRLELKGNKYVLGEFLEFKGKQEDAMPLRNIKRSKVSRLIIQKTSMFGLASMTGLLILLHLPLVTIEVEDKHYFEKVLSCTKMDLLIPKHFTLVHIQTGSFSCLPSACSILPSFEHTSNSKLQVLYSGRDYRSEGASASEWKEETVRSSTEVLFQPQNSAKVRKFKLSSIISMTLSA